MSNIAIHIEKLGKMYRIGGPQEKYKTFRDAVTRAAVAPLRRVRDLMRGQAASDLQQDIWALKDISFDINHGEVVGIIGRNGAGKSTLLKILSSITEPTSGYAEIYGRVGALLEVGTGFHPELTGRENVYLNGAILGMPRADINRKFDEIVDFAGVDKFIDTPVKHYSSGMGLRLGFAVAAHLEPDILVVDEVLAVGDAEFQRKCLGKMRDTAGEGRTVLFVSHNLGAVAQLCQRGVVLNKGRVVLVDKVSKALEHYTSALANADTSDETNHDSVYISQMTTDHEDFDPSKPITFSFKVTTRKELSTIRIAIQIYNEKQTWIVGEVIDAHAFPQLLVPGTYMVHAALPPLWLSAGHYTCYIKSTVTAGINVERVKSEPFFMTCSKEASDSNVTKDKERILAVPIQWQVEEK